MQNIGIFCSASDKLKEVFEKEAIKMGEWIGKNGKTLINGGSNQGLMEVFSNTVRRTGGHCIGVIPENFSKRGWYSNSTDEKIIVKNLSERKDVIKKRSDVLIVFPGGIGTMDEFFDAWSSYSLGFHDKKIILVNIDGFFTPLIQQLRVFRQEKFLHDFLPNPLLIVNSVEDCIKQLETMDCFVKKD
ncbi:MAG: TIGR00730 family Rossman fold protein [Bacteroidales bacterium]|nr:TIGR00730 family Rossman fold protein [Bacteroidales bacterium]MDD3907233.1 TIGR00730 family Rossman fold protein [Bacteroidales bacterium]MDD4711727.1 TIGR00730 family Rossman fold protein [Bacteroidales bacterium]